MIVRKEKFDIELSRIDNYIEENEKTYFPEEYEYQLSTKIRLTTYNNGELISTVFIGSFGGGTGIHETSQIIEQDRIVICCSESIFCLSIPMLDLIWETKTDYESCFEVFKVEDFYIVHGETFITRLDLDGNIVWQKSGKDIFVTEENIDDFSIHKSYILAKDWSHKVYRIDFDGREIID